VKKIKWGNFIHSDPSVFLGKPVVKGTRLSVEFILGLDSEGWTEDQILENYPNLTKESLLAVFAYTHECMRKEFLYPLSVEAATDGRRAYPSGRGVSAGR
jgi:uncharacterized protein (DUF433 family)